MSIVEKRRQIDKLFYEIGFQEVQKSVENFEKDDKFRITNEIRKGNGKYELSEFLRRKTGYIQFDIHEISKYVDITVGFKGLHENIYGEILEVFARELYHSNIDIQNNDYGITYHMKSNDISMPTTYYMYIKLKRHTLYQCNMKFHKD